MSNKGRILGIDYGRSRIGLSISDESCSLATALGYLKNNSRFFPSLIDTLKLYVIKLVVVGLPVSMTWKDVHNKGENRMTMEVKEFAHRLSTALQIPVDFMDERLTTEQVSKFLKGHGVKRKKRAELTDQLAAALILQSYLDRGLYALAE